MATESPKLHAVPSDEEISIAKPTAFNLDKFKSKRPATVAGVQQPLTALPHHNIAAAKDFVRLHPNEEKFWSPELCFVNVPIKGMKHDTLHLIDEDLAFQYVPSGKIQRFRLVLAAKPHDIFFLCHVPSQNADNPWNATNIKACETAKTRWVEATSRKAEGVEAYKIGHTRDVDAFPNPNWPKQCLDELIQVTFVGRMIVTENDPALLRLVGAKQALS
jgi:hypothetical protein